tara:strand:+ start:415 stop:789 length:375 start_codon:yes stop_codon:yes gene_type:complete
MATQIVIANKESIFLDNTFYIAWADKGKNWVDAWTPDTIHYVIWNDLPGQNEIQNKDADGNMTGNTNLNATSDAVGSTTIADLLTWGETRKGQIEAAQTAHSNAIDAGTATDSETWRDYDSNYS